MHSRSDKALKGSDVDVNQTCQSINEESLENRSTVP